MIGRLWLLVVATMIGWDVASKLAASPIPQGAELLKTDLIVVLAHPDDETGLAPTLAYYALGQDRRIAAVYVTRGEGGGNMVGRQGGAALGLLRESELRHCLAALGIERAYFLGELDWAYTESARMTLDVWDAAAVQEQLTRLFRTLRPEIVVTMNPIPTPGQHGHHQATAILAIESFQQSARPDAFPEQLDREGLDLWQPRKLYITGPAEPYGAVVNSDQQLTDGQSAAKVAGLALSHHRSQGFGGMTNAPWLDRPRSFRLLYSSVGFQRNETDLFHGLPTQPDPVAPVQPEPVTIFTTPPSWRFAARPAIERFRQWATAQALPELAVSLEADQPVPAGQQTRIQLVADDPSAAPPTDLRLEISDNWTAQIAPTTSPAGPIIVEVLPPESARSSATLIARWNQNGRTLESRINLKPVPLAELRRTDRPPTADPFVLDSWSEATVLDIPHTLTWEGSAVDNLDSSATVRLFYTQDALHALVQVRDDLVIANIAPNDIRGHWRSDSIEICVDPEAGSEHTLETFKVGIFPFDTTGQVRAARDADARQGPIEQTAPGMTLASERTPNGYQVATSIPWKLIGINPQPGRLLGFNVLVYDGDKPAAVVGENINKSRLAWSPQRGVQGRPEDWGRLRLQ